MRAAGFAALAAAACVLALAGVIGAVAVDVYDAGFSRPPPPAFRRKLLAQGAGHGRRGGGGGGARTERVGEGCGGVEDIAIYQGATRPLPSGVPTYTVDVINECVSVAALAAGGGGGCAIGDIHVRCGWFSSVHLIDPRLFRRVGHDDCLLNDGRPLGAGDSLSFVYANSFPYKLSVSSASCLPNP